MAKLYSASAFQTSTADLLDLVGADALLARVRARCAGRRRARVPVAEVAGCHDLRRYERDPPHDHRRAPSRPAANAVEVAVRSLPCPVIAENTTPSWSGAGFAGMFMRLPVPRARPDVSASTRRATTSAARGTGTGTRARAATSRASSTRTSSPRSSSRNGSGPSATPVSPRSCGTRTTSPTASTSGATCSSTPRVTDATFDDPDGPVAVRTDARRRRHRAVPRSWRRAASRPPTSPDFEGLDSFAGLHSTRAAGRTRASTSRGKRVGVVGTGSSGIQAIPVIAEQAAELFVFQRTPQFSIPARNQPLADAEQAEVKADYAGLPRAQRTT